MLSHVDVLSIALQLVCWHTIGAVCATTCALLHRRHLMVWAVFAPKFCFEAIG